MTKTEFLETLLAENVRYYRVNGFLLSYQNTQIYLKGRIPLKLARKIREGIDTSRLEIAVSGCSYLDEPEEWATNSDLAYILSECIHNLRHDTVSIYHEKKQAYIKQAELDDKLDDIYVLFFTIGTVEGLKHVIKCIRESGYINQCLWA